VCGHQLDEFIPSMARHFIKKLKKNVNPQFPLGKEKKKATAIAR